MRNQINPDQIKQVVFEWASNVGEPIRVYLFGSRHRGDARPDSDIDLAVEFLCDFEDYSEWFLYRLDFEEKWGKALTNKFGVEVDLEFFHPQHTENLKSYLAESSQIIFPA